MTVELGSALVFQEDEAIFVEAGRTEDAKLLRLRSNIPEEDMATVEALLAETIADKDAETAKAMEEKDKALDEKDKVIEA